MGASKSFNGTSDFIEVSDYTEIQDVFNSGGSVSFWVYKIDNGDQSRILSKFISEGWRIIFTLDNKIILRANFSTDNGRWDIFNINFNQLYNISITYDSSLDANDPIFYVDGNQTTIDNEEAPSGTYTSDVGNNLLMGKEGTQFLEGRLSHVQIWDRVLSADEIVEQMEKPGSIANGLVGYWPLVESGSTLRNLSRIGNDGTVTGATESDDGPPIRSIS